MSKRPSDTLSTHSLPPSKRLSRSSSPALTERQHLKVHVVSAPTVERCSVSQPQFRPPTASSSSTPPNPSAAQYADPAVSDSSACNSGYPGVGTTGTDNVKLKCFRISNIPLDWSEDKLLAALKVIDPLLESQNPELSLHPACCDATQTALLNLDLRLCAGYFYEVQQNKSYHRRASDGAILVIDSHFYGLTQLNTPEADIVADVIAVTGLAGHAFGSWKSRETQEMWLKDFLPMDIGSVRIMTYGYDSSIVGPERSSSNLIDYRRSFIQQLDNSRSSVKNRPIIFVGHSMGGILILQTLIESKRNPHHESILNSTYGIIFFGTPHRGLRTGELESVVDVNSEQTRYLLTQLKEDSEFIENQKEDLLPIFERLKERKIISFYETEKTPSVRMLRLGEVRRDGAKVQMVQRSSAQFYSPYEHRIPVSKNHTDMVKFSSPADDTYRTVVKYMKECIAGIRALAVLWSDIGRMAPNRFLRILHAVSQEKYKFAIPLLDSDQPKFYWIFKNMDYSRWHSADGTQVLWLCGPPECHIRDVSSHIVDLANKVSGTQQIVLYFFCSAMTGARSMAIIFVRELLKQIVCRLPPLDQAKTIALFLGALIDETSRRLSYDDLSMRFGMDDSLGEKISKVLDVSGDEYWNALKAVFDVKQKPALFLIIDGLHKIQHERDEFIKEVRCFVEHLQETSWTAKVLLTSRPQAAIAKMLDGLPFIEYDKERKECLNTLRFDNARYGNIEEEHEGSLKWLWEHEKYKEWSSTNSSNLLLIEGKPGSGKSTLAKYFKLNLFKCEPLARQAIAGGFFYSHREGELQTNHSSMLRSILYDVLDHNEAFFFHFQRYYRQAQQSSGHFQWPYDSLKKILLSLGDHPVKERLFLVVDAIDESNDEDRREIVELLGQICSVKKTCIIKIFLSSRPVPELNRRTLRDHKVIKLQDVNGPDISKFAGAFLGSDLELCPEIRHQATAYIAKNAQGVFIWVRLVKAELLNFAERGYSKKEIFSFLKGLPTELGEFYERILDRLVAKKEKDIKDGVKMFRLVIFARRLLRLEEFQHALAIPDDLDAEFLPSDHAFDEDCIQGIDKRIIYCGANFLEIKDVDGSSYVQVMHQTVREFFLGPNGHVAKSMFSIGCEDSHARISIVCIRYLMLCVTSTTLKTRLPPIESWASKHFEDYAQYLNKRPFINYILSHLMEHITNSGNSRDILLQLCSQFSRQLAESPTSHLLENCAAFPVQKHSDKSFRNRILHTASKMQLSRVVETLLIASAEIEAARYGKTPLMVSAEGGDEATARVLLARGASIAAKNSQSQRALHFAAINGHDSMVKLLVDRGADKEAIDAAGKTALHFAAASGHETTVRLLIETLGADKKAKCRNARTALHWAVLNGHFTTVKLLVESLGVETETRTTEGQTALHLAAERAYNTIVRLLVETLKADKESRTTNEQTALHLAVERGHNTTVRLLVETLGADKEARTMGGLTALHLATEKGYNTIVRLLVETLGADKEARTTDEWTPLHIAATMGYNTIVRLLVETLGANKEARTREGRTALHLAAERGYNATVRLLVETFGADKEARTSDGRTALHLATERGYDTIAQLLIESSSASE